MRWLVKALTIPSYSDEELREAHDSAMKRAQATLDNVDAILPPHVREQTQITRRARASSAIDGRQKA